MLAATRPSTPSKSMESTGPFCGTCMTCTGCSGSTIAIKDRWPDLTIILDLPVEKAMARINRQKDRIEQRPREYHEQVRRNYLAQAAADPKHYRVISADRPPEAVHEDIWKEFDSL